MTFEPMERRRPRVIPRYARIDVIGGGVIVFLAGLIWYGAIGLNVGTMADFGTGAMPKALSIVLLAIGGVLLILGLTQPNEDAERFDIAIRPMAIVVIAILLFGLFIRGGNFALVTTPQLGLMVVGPLTVFIAGCATPQMDVKALLVLSFGLTAAMLLVFVDLLGVTIPIFPKHIQNAIALSFDAETAVRFAYSVYGALAAILYIIFFGLPGKRLG
jgi:hypothetical protein